MFFNDNIADHGPFVQYIEGEVPVPIPDASGQVIVPSVVAFRKDGSTLIGSKAKRCTSLPFYTQVTSTAGVWTLHTCSRSLEMRWTSR